ncbi:MAG: hypothetical protein IKW15_01015, partial [Bacteroidales bacterium]|nr:hypothetical protein [Bacteroidales bacterium]
YPLHILNTYTTKLQKISHSKKSSHIIHTCIPRTYNPIRAGFRAIFRLYYFLNHFERISGHFPAQKNLHLYAKKNGGHTASIQYQPLKKAITP